MNESGTDAAPRLALQPVVADGRGGAEALLEVARLQEPAFALGAVGPDAREAVGLQLQCARRCG